MEAGVFRVYLGRHVHEVIQHEGCRLRGPPATALQPVRGCRFSVPVLDVVLRAAGARPWEEQPAVHQLDVVQPGQQVGEHDLAPIGVRRGKPLAHLWGKAGMESMACIKVPKINSNGQTQQGPPSTKHFHR